MNTQAIPVEQEHLEVVSTDQAYRVHLHYEKEKTFSIAMLCTGAALVLAGVVLMLFVAHSAYLSGIAFILLVAGAVLSYKGFLVNLSNQRNYFELVRMLTAARQYTTWFNRQEHKRVGKVLLLLATEEILLSLIFATVLILLHLVQGSEFWQGAFETLLSVITVLLIANAYRTFIYSRYSNKIKSEIS